MQGTPKKRVALLSSLVIVFAMLLSACGSSTTTNNTSGMAPASKQIFSWGELGPADFGSALDPAQVQDQVDNYALQTFMTGLVQQNDKGQLVDQLAQSHTISSDGLTYTFKLRSNLKWNDGTALTAQDVAYGINRTIIPATNSPVAQYLSLIKGFDKVNSGKESSIIGDGVIVQDPSTLVVKLSQPASYFLYTFTYPTSYPVEKSLIDKYGKSWTDHLSEGGCDGPFKVQTYSHTVGLDLVPNPNYSGLKPKLSKLEIHIVGSTDVAYKSFQSHNLDYTVVPIEQINSAKNLTGVLKGSYHDVPILGNRQIQMNYLAKPFDNIKVRQAFMLALNRNLISQTLFHGVYQPTNRLVPAPEYGSSPTEVPGPDGTTNFSGNPALAKQLLQEGLKEDGYTLATMPPVSYTVTNNTNPLGRANAYIDEWKTVLGVNVKLNAVTADQDSKLIYSNQGKSTLSMWDYGWQDDYPDPQDWITKFFGAGANYNNENYGQNNSATAAQQRALQTQMVAADVNPDPNARSLAYQAIEKQLVQQVGYIPVAQLSSYYVLNPKIHGYQEDAFGVIAPDDWANIYVTQ